MGRSATRRSWKRVSEIDMTGVLGGLIGRQSGALDDPHAAEQVLRMRAGVPRSIMPGRKACRPLMRPHWLTPITHSQSPRE